MDWPPIALTPSQDSTACHMHARCGAGKSSKMPRSIIFSSLVLPLFFCVCEKASSRTTYKRRGLGPVKRCRLALLFFGKILALLPTHVLCARSSTASVVIDTNKGSVWLVLR